MQSRSQELTHLLNELRQGNKDIQSRVASLIYSELRRIAGNFVRKEPHRNEIDPSALVNDAYMHLVLERDRTWHSRIHFFSEASTVIRHLLVDMARKRRAAKHGGNLTRVTLTDCFASPQANTPEILDLGMALEKLEELNPALAKLVDLRFFAGLSMDEIAELMGTSRRTADRKWDVARKWLYTELSQNHESISVAAG